MPFRPFELEVFMSEFERTVEFNFSESGVHPLRLGELLKLAGREPGELLDTLLDYAEVNGEELLRERIAALYPGADAGNVLVTVGASEANMLAATTLLEPGDKVAAITPTYLQFNGIASNVGASVQGVSLVESEGWRLDLGALAETVGEDTKVISLVNPNNPTGSILSPQEEDAVIAAAARSGAWIVADEVYAGTELEKGVTSRSFYGRYDKVLALGSLSKAYGLPGLRLGWVAGPHDVIQSLWRRHEYAVLSATTLGNRLATIALDPDVRPRILERTQSLIRSGFGVLTEYLETRPDVFHVVPPAASAISFVGYDLPQGSSDFARGLREQQSVLMIPGDCFGLDHHLRVSSALPHDYLRAGLGRFLNYVDGLAR